MAFFFTGKRMTIYWKKPGNQPIFRQTGWWSQCRFILPLKDCFESTDLFKVFLFFCWLYRSIEQTANQRFILCDRTESNPAKHIYQYDSALKMHKKHQESTRKWWVANMKILDDDSHHQWWWLDLWKHPRYAGENWWMRWNWWNYLCSFLCGYNLAIIYLRVGGTLIDVLAI